MMRWWAVRRWVRRWTHRIFGRPMYCKQCGRSWRWWPYSRTRVLNPGPPRMVDACPVCGAKWWRDESE